MKLLILCFWLMLSFPVASQIIVTLIIEDESQNRLEAAAVQVKTLDSIWYSNSEGIANLHLEADVKYDLSIHLLGHEDLFQMLKVSNDTTLVVTLQWNPFVTNPVEVISTWAGDRTPISYTTLDQQELERQNFGQDIPYLLKWSPSVVETSDAGTGIGYTSMRIRGSDITRINVTINGVPLNDAESQAVFWVDLPDFANSTSLVQIQRGVGTSTNGAGAFGASINLQTKKYSSTPTAQLSTGIGSFGTWQASGQASSGLIGKVFHFSGRISTIQSQGYIDRAEANLNSYFLSGSYVNKNTSIQLNTFSGSEVTYQAWNGVPVQYARDPKLRKFNSAGIEKPGIPHDNEVDDYRQTHYQLIMNQSFQENIHLNITGHYTHGQGFFEQYKSSQDLLEYDLAGSSQDLIRRLWLDNDFYGVLSSIRFSSNRSELTVGGAYNEYKGRHFGNVKWMESLGVLPESHEYYRNHSLKKDFNIYSKMEQEIGKFMVYADLQYRYIDYEFLGFNRQLENVMQRETLHFFNPKVGVDLSLDKYQRVFASLSWGHHEPNRNDYTESTPDNRPNSESLTDFEVGWSISKPEMQLSANAFAMLYKDQLVLTGKLNDVGAYTRQNIKASYRLGLELSAAYQMTQHYTIAFQSTISENKIQSFTEYIDNWDTGEQDVRKHSNSAIAFSPGLIGNAIIRYNEDFRGSDLEVSLNNKFVSRQFLDNTNSSSAFLDPYSYTDLIANWSVQPKGWISEITLSVQVRNLWNRLYSSNGWNYRFHSAQYDPVPDDPYARHESGSSYSLTGLYTQAGGNLHTSVTVKF